VSEFASRYPETIREGILGENAARLWRLRA
jgi:predicted TIM-barrel fold metal-dependent hydrolase